jgi:hypothetical protein
LDSPGRAEAYFQSGQCILFSVVFAPLISSVSDPDPRIQLAQWIRTRTRIQECKSGPKEREKKKKFNPYALGFKAFSGVLKSFIEIHENKRYFEKPGQAISLQKVIIGVSLRFETDLLIFEENLGGGGGALQAGTGSQNHRRDLENGY